jgi:hypothetical protein
MCTKLAGFEDMKKDVGMMREVMALLNGNMKGVESGAKMLEGNMVMIDSAKMMMEEKVGGVMKQLSQVTQLTDGVKDKVDGVEKSLLEKFPEAKKHLG